MDIKKIFMVIVTFLVLVLLIQNITAFEFDNAKEWDSNSRTLTVKNSFGFGDTIATVKGLTPHINYVFYGDEVVVAEFEINNVEKVYKNALKDMEFFDIKKSNKKFDREFTFRYKFQNGTKEIPIYETICSDGLNPKDCISKVIGYSYIPTYEIKNLEDTKIKDLPKGKIIIQIVTNVNPNERVEFIPTWFGIRMEEFAVWDSNLDTYLIEYFPLENRTLIDYNVTDYFTGDYTGNVTDGDRYVIGKINQGMIFPMTTKMPSVYGNNSFLDVGSGAEFTINAWFKRDSGTIGTIWGSGKATSNMDFKFATDFTSVGMNPDTLTCGGYQGSTWNNQVAQSTTNVTDGQWHMGTCGYNGSHMLIYVDSVLEGWQAVSTIVTAPAIQSIGTNAQNGEGFVGLIDEVGLWNSSLTQSQITQLYNSGNGLIYPASPFITLISPTNNSNVLSPVEFKCNSDDYEGLLNLTLIIDSSNNYTVTNTSANQGYLSVDTLVEMSLGSYTYNCKAVDINGKTTLGEQRSIIVKAFTENSQTFNNPVLEGTSQLYTLNITYNSSIWNAVTGKLIYNNTQYTATKIGGNNPLFSRTIDTPNLEANTNITFYWELTFYGATSQKQNSTTQTQQVNNFNLDDCSVYSNLLYNFTLRDEETRAILDGTNNNTLIEIQIESNIFNFSNSYSQENPAHICSDIAITNSSYNVDITASYKADGYVQEFYYAENDVLGNTTKQINLHDLKTSDSTTFLFYFYDSNGLPVDNSIAHVFRRYIGDGIFREVERSKEDADGETHVHLVEEDVIYYFKISLNGDYIYTSDTYNARCISTPCQIILKASDEISVFDTNWDLIDNGGYVLTYDRSTRDVEVQFDLDDEALINLSVFEYNSQGVYSLIDSDALSSIAGTLTVNIPLSSGNKTYFASVFKDGNFVRSHWIDLNEEAGVYFGYSLALFLTFLIILSLTLMAISQGAGVLIFLVLGVFLTSALGFVNTITSTGTNLIIYLLLAGGLLLYKLVKERN